ncbi:MAG: molecular chaperone HtpG [Alphaproteobacteria bacterium]|nr:molecular chaperone HtpG [Alphaproteobacteria bacterium]
MTEETQAFQAEVGRLLDLMIHSVYSEKQIFLRELISNASDACDRRRYLALTQPDLAPDAGAFKITVAVDKPARALTVRDNGIGMNRDDLVQHLGTIAKSGTAAFVDQMSGDARKDMALIGQFGIGFYSAFMVADQVDVLSLKAGETAAWRWRSDGKGAFSIAAAGKEAIGTDVVLHLRPGEDEYLDPHRLRHIIKTYSDHIAVPIELAGEGEAETVNDASALWTRARSEIAEGQYKEFYRHVAHAFDTPWLTLHYSVEGKVEYTGLLFVPSAKPLDLFHPDHRPGVKLYVRRVFITDDAKDLVPGWLRFLRGVVDSQDLPLNISREMLQNNPVLAQIRATITRRVLGELERKAEAEPEAYAAFWGNFGAVLKEGLYEDPSQRETLLKLARFRSTAADGWVTLADYMGRMRPGQEAIYYIAGDAGAALTQSPQLEGFKARGIEVLLLADPVDEFWIPAVGSHGEKPLRSVTRGTDELATIEPVESAPARDEPAVDLGGLIALFKLTLKDGVKDVRGSNRLTDSPVCLVADAGDMDLHLERLLKQHRQTDRISKRILELNPRHALIRGLVARLGDAGAHDTVVDMAHVLLDQARIVEGEPLPDPAAFTRRLAGLLQKGIAAS